MPRNVQTAVYVLSAASNNEQVVKAAAGDLLRVEVLNLGSEDIVLHWVDKATAPTPGSETQKWTSPAPAPGLIQDYTAGEKPAFQSGISFYATSGGLEETDTAVVVGDKEVVVQVIFR